MKTYHIHIEGRVQGVGFRPFIYGLVKKLGFTGTISNSLDGVHLFVNCGTEEIEVLVDQIRQLTPVQSIITSLEIKEVTYRKFDDLRIVESSVNGNPDLLITPDFAICEDCKRELLDVNNKRFQYPYITCTSCGPRFSIETALPYDRQRTSMENFAMCAECSKEYEDPTDRRFYSQTNTCPDCLVSQWVTDPDGNQIDLSQEETTNFVCEKIKEGSVVAVKGIGGFLLMCDAANEKSVKKLRSKKDRPTKPFALMYPDKQSLEENFHVSEVELTVLESAGAPIVLLRLKDASKDKRLINLITPGLNRLGVMLPYTPLFELIQQKLHRPLLATSGNLKGSPICYQNESAIKSLGSFVDYFLLNDRDIQIPQDDSVIKFSEKYLHKIIIRRSRGYAPGFLQKGIDNFFDKKVLAMGALLKSTFSIWQNGRCHISQFLGDSTQLNAQLSFESCLDHFRNLLKFNPEVVVVDKHPAYFSTHMGKEIAHDLKIKTVSIQHHEAHFYAVLAEHDLLRKEESILGVIFDGTGMGHDGAIWGGEFLLYSGGTVKRSNHVGYFPHILGDKMSVEPRLSALSILHAADCEDHLDTHLFSDQELDYFNKVLDHSSLKTSSMGRVFDAVSSILGLCHFNSYEGEAAMYLEKAAQEYCSKNREFPMAYNFEILTDGSINLCPMIKSIIEDFNLKKDVGFIAASFHRTVAGIIEEIAARLEVQAIAFSGGVMQNGLLVDMIYETLRDKYKLHFHQELSPNDECISYGQLAGFMLNYRLLKKKKKLIQNH